MLESSLPRLMGRLKDVREAELLRAQAFAWLEAAHGELDSSFPSPSKVGEKARALLREVERVAKSISSAKEWLHLGPWLLGPSQGLFELTNPSILLGEDIQTFHDLVSSQLMMPVDVSKAVELDETPLGLQATHTLALGEINPEPLEPFAVTQCRESMGFSRNQFAKLLGISRSALREWERRGTPRGPVPILLRLMASSVENES